VAGEIAALIAINQIPCTCRWLVFAEQLTRQVLFPSGILAQLSSSMPRMYNCPKNTANGEYSCNSLSISHPLSIPEIYMTTQSYAARYICICVCVYVCVCVCVCVCVYIYTCIHIHVYYVHMCICIHVYICTMYVCIHMYIYIYTMCVYIYTYTYIHTYTHI
jgi:hypothetical protein